MDDQLVMEDQQAMEGHPAMEDHPAVEYQPATKHQPAVEAGQAGGSSGSEKAIVLNPGSSANDPEAPVSSNFQTTRNACCRTIWGSPASSLSFGFVRQSWAVL
ncbi:hypothetical protein OUZ56_026211 [Daphnia magna]|uniref:Uncharacterized protein n=1 Tax=Daphnia magna TaxID=35525 RepID=A0ABQ9ZMG4_9CRUS|nr:hypothetical protein OUZ56_026211 [Daphnia magna]